MRRFTIDIVTDGSGNATALTPRLSGKVQSIHYVKPGAASFTDGVDFTVTAEATSEPIWAELNVNASSVRYPRTSTHSTVGAASLYAAGGTPVQTPIAIANDRIKIAVASGGAAKTGKFHILID